MSNMTEQRPLGQLFSDLASETAALIRHEVDLAKVEMTTKARSYGHDAAKLAAGGLIALLGAIALLFALVFALAEAMPLWTAALLVGVAVGGLGAALVVNGLHAFKRIDPAPRETLQTLQENKQWLREQVSR